ncbi:MAG: FixH family protein [Hyphomicrobiales bacterium]|nr:FixH family protein [Hyphomicrobiales bacterium]
MPRDVALKRAAGTELKGIHVLMTLLAFFGVVFAVNFYFLHAALKTYGGVVAVEPYRKGLAYNDRIEADTRQKEAGWSSALDVAASGRIAFELRDAASGAVSGRMVTVTLGRPATQRFDRVVGLAETAPGRYEAAGEALPEGTWVAGVDVRERADADPVYRIRRRLWLKL